MNKEVFAGRLCRVEKTKMTQSRDIGYNKGQKMIKKPRVPKILPLGLLDVHLWRIVPIISEVLSKHCARGLCTITVRSAIPRTASQSSSNPRVIPTEYATERASLIINQYSMLNFTVFFNLLTSLITSI